MEEFLKTLGINKAGYYSKDNSYVVDLEDSDEYGKIYTILDNSTKVEEIESESQVTLHSSNIVYSDSMYQLTLLSDFDADTYKLVVRKYKDK